MRNIFLNLLRPPVFPKNDEKTRVAKTLHQILLISFSLPVLASLVILFNSANFVLVPIISIFAIGILILMAANRAGRVRLASIIYVLFLIIFFAYADVLTGGTSSPELILLTSIVILISGLLLGGNAPVLVAITLVVLRFSLSTLGDLGLISRVIPTSSLTQEVLIISMGYLLIAVLFRQSTIGIQSAVEKLRESQRALETTNLELSELTRNLEQRVAERTGELGLANTKNERRAAQFEAIARCANFDSADDFVP